MLDSVELTHLENLCPRAREIFGGSLHNNENTERARQEYTEPGSPSNTCSAGTTNSIVGFCKTND